MWPVQTLTLLLCLTEEEQLFAQRPVLDKELPAVVAPAPQAVDEADEALVLDLSC